MLREPRQRDLEHDLPGALRPAFIPLRLFEPFQFATDIDQHTGELRPYGLQRPGHPFLRGDDIIAQGSGMRGRRAPRPVGRGGCRPVRRDPLAKPREPIVGPEALAGRILRIGDQRPAVSVLSTSKPAQWALRFVHRHVAANALDIPKACRPDLMLVTERVGALAIATERRLACV
jgi:hypothetical protein